VLRRVLTFAYRIIPLPRAAKLPLAHLVFRLTGTLFDGSVLYERWRRPRKSMPLPDELERRAAAIAFPPAAAPVVSIVIPTRGNVPYALACLESIARQPPRVACEVLLVEDASGEALVERLAAVSGLRFIRNERNLGFLRSCNRAAALARGEYLHLLNDDTEVTAGWLDALLETFRLPACGIAGSKLLYADGRLQEAGGRILADGREERIGRWGDPAQPEYNRVCEVDYCSAASLLLPRRLFLELGGFDERYAPAYYEDVDLALRVRAAGGKVYYQPASQVVHHESVSYQPDPARHARSRRVFEARWRETLNRARVS
jgi:GT2 family glycosyltransferase